MFAHKCTFRDLQNNFNLIFSWIFQVVATSKVIRMSSMKSNPAPTKVHFEISKKNINLNLSWIFQVVPTSKVTRVPSMKSNPAPKKVHFKISKNNINLNFLGPRGPHGIPCSAMNNSLPATSFGRVVSGNKTAPKVPASFLSYPVTVHHSRRLLFLHPLPEGLWRSS